MQSNLGLIFETLSDEVGFKLITASNNSVDVIFEDSPSLEYLGQTNAVVFQATDEIKATSFTSNENIVLYLNKSTNIPQVFSLKFKNSTSLVKINDSQLKININGSAIYVDFTDCKISNNDINSISIMMNNSDATIEFSTQFVTTSLFSNVSIQSVEDSRMIIPVSKRIPEFIISIYDDSRFNYPRPLRFGVPVISTVPSVPQFGETLYQENKDLLEFGVGTQSRKMFFVVVSDQKIDESLRDNLSLEIDLPAGSDTVEKTTNVKLEYVKTIDTNDVFSSSYVFHKEDTIDYVDGFAYLSVKMPLRIQRNLPLSFQVTSDGTPYVDEVMSIITEGAGGIEEIAVEFDTLSIDTNIVQPKLTSKQDLKAENKKNKKSIQNPEA